MYYDAGHKIQHDPIAPTLEYIRKTRMLLALSRLSYPQPVKKD